MLLGSSYKNVGVQPLMDAVVDYLPAPSECAQPAALSLYAPNLCALAFKILHDPQRGGILTFLRLYSGRLEKVGFDGSRATTRELKWVISLLNSSVCCLSFSLMDSHFFFLSYFFCSASALNNILTVGPKEKDQVE